MLYLKSNHPRLNLPMIFGFPLSSYVEKTLNLCVQNSINPFFLKATQQHSHKDKQSDQQPSHAVS